MKNTKKGEMLLETVMSTLFIMTLLIPISNLIFKSYKTNISMVLIEKKIYFEKDIIEIIKSFKYEKISNLSCSNKKFSNSKDLLLYLNITDIDSNEDLGEFYLTIEKNDMLFNKNIYGYRIKIGNIEDVYIPKAEK